MCSNSEIQYTIKTRDFLLRLIDKQLGKVMKLLKKIYDNDHIIYYMLKSLRFGNTHNEGMVDED